MKISSQITLGELITKLEAIEDKAKPVIFDETYCPVDVDSWRGDYYDLALTYGQDKPLSTLSFLARLKDAIGSKFQGYKGGWYVMSNDTPVWVANHGHAEGFKQEEDRWTLQAVVGVSENNGKVIIETRNDEAHHQDATW